MRRPSALVVGGGLAGITAALRLAETGAEVTLLEGRPRLGGATSSFVRHGMPVDTGQHVLLRCYTAYRRLLDDLGVTGAVDLQPFRVPVLDARGGRHTLRRWPLPAPAHLLPVLLGYRCVPLRERLRLVPAMAALRRLDPDDPSTDRRSFGAWLAEVGQGDRAVQGLWRLIALAALNGEPADVSLALAARVFRTGLLSAADAPDIGIPTVPLADLHGRPAAAALARRGVRVRLDTPVRAVEPAPGGLSVRLDGGQALGADAVVVAVPPGPAGRLLPGPVAPAGWAGLGSSPILNVHVVYDRPVTDLPFAATIGSPAQWIFDKTRVAGLADGQYLAVSVSGADQEIDRPVADLRTTYLAELERLFPAAGSTRVRDVFVTRERAATFRQAPGTRALRPPARTGLRGLVLAGAWVDTGWPDTMEGAVRSGEQAGRLAADHLAGVAGAVEVTA